MKANEAPEKIYLIRNILTSTSLNTTNDCHEKYLQEWYKGREKDTDIEYTRTDVFIEKACEYISEHVEYYMKKDKACNVPLCPLFAIKSFIEDFKKYMEGE